MKAIFDDHCAWESFDMFHPECTCRQRPVRRDGGLCLSLPRPGRPGSRDTVKSGRDPGRIAAAA